MKATVRKEKDDYCDVIIADDDSDSLVILQVQRDGDTLMVRTGLRGNTDADERPIEWHYAGMEAPLLIPGEFQRRVAQYKIDKWWRFLDEPLPDHATQHRPCQDLLHRGSQRRSRAGCCRHGSRRTVACPSRRQGSLPALPVTELTAGLAGPYRICEDACTTTKGSPHD